MKHESISQELEHQLEFLKERHRFVDKVLDLSLKLNDFSMLSIDTISPSDILTETLARLNKLLSFNIANFYLVDGEGANFYPADILTDPDDLYLVDREKDILVNDGSFAWALGRNKPVLFSASDDQGTVVLHSMSTSNRTMGMFVGLIAQGKGELLDSHLYFMTVVLNSAASVLQYIELYSTVQKLNSKLQNKVDQLTSSKKRLTIYKAKLEKLVKLRTLELGDSNQRLGNTLSGVVDAMGKIVELRDPYTAGHQRRVSSIASALASGIGLTEDEVEGVRIAGLVHDIGKISIPTEILTKPAKLGPLELEMVRGHPGSGCEMLHSIDFPWPVSEMVLQHHERVNGSGYPRGLKGDQILPGSKCLAVADVVEAISSHRPYRPSLGVDAALSELEDNRGVLYDASVVDVCISLIKEPGFAAKYLD